ncbi:MAG: hypothetical protein MUP64_10505, partial [Anaerolineae bacterium]|nr:hypothetical protein [Anaerolineae bacterium]
RAAQVIHEEADRMAHLVDSLLDLAGIEAGQVVMAREPVQKRWLLAPSRQAYDWKSRLRETRWFQAIATAWLR